MRLLWTKSTTALSRFIRLILGDDCSHFSFVFESAAKGLVFESNLFGTHPTFLSTSMRNHTVIHEIDVNLSLEDEDLIWDEIVQRYDGRPYDFGGAIYLGWWKFLHRFFKVKIPLKNKWNSPNSYFCNELYVIFSLLPHFPDVGISSGMETPHDLWLKLKDWKP